MQNNRLNYILVGSFVLAMILALVLSIALLTGQSGASDEYFTDLNDATGLKFGSKVFYMGYAVGQVEAIRPVLKDGHLRFELSLSIAREFADWRVPVDSIAKVEATGLLAAITIDIRAGQSKESLKPGDWIQGMEKIDVLEAVAETAHTVKEIAVTSLKPLMNNLNRYVTSFGTALEQEGVPLLANLNRLSRHLADRGPEIVSNFLATSTEIRKASEGLSALLSEENTGKVGNVLDNVVQSSEELLQLTTRANRRFDELVTPELLRGVQGTVDNTLGASADLRHLSHSARQGIERVLSSENLQNLDNSLANLEQATANIRAMAGPEQVKSVQATVRRIDAAATELNALISDSRRQLATLLGPRTAQKVQTTLDNISAASRSIARMSDNMNQRIGEILTPQVSARIKHALENFADAAAGIARLTAGLEASREQLDELLIRLNAITRENRPPIRDTVRSLRYSLGIVAEHIDAVSRNLEDTSRNMVEFSRLIKQNPGMLLRNTSPPDDGPITATGTAQGG